MVGNSIAQSAQPIISYNYGLGLKQRVVDTEKLAILTALIFGLLLMGIFISFPNVLVALFLNVDTPTARIAIAGLPIFAIAFIPFIFNLTAIGYFQAVERVKPSIIFAVLRGTVFIVPIFFVMANLLGITGLWLSLALSEILTSVCIITYYLLKHNNVK